MKILMTSITFIPSNIMCGDSQLKYLQKEGILEYKFILARKLKKKDVDWADTIIFLRSDTDIEAFVSEYAKKAGKHLVYVLDDDILNCPEYLSCYLYYSYKSTKRSINKIMSNCDVFLTPSPVLLEKYGHIFNKSYLINEPSLNRIKTKKENKKVKIGFAGSIDRTQDLNVILEGTITKLVKKYKNKIEIEIMGAHPDFVDTLNLKYLPYQDGYENYMEYMKQLNWDIGLAPMPDSDFHRCKYFNKYVEYSSFGIVGVYSNLKPYIYGIKNKINGILVNNNTEDWFNAICSLIEDKQLRESISKECIKQANEIYSLDVLANEYYNKCIDGFIEKETYGYIPSLELIKIEYWLRLLGQKITEKKFMFPIWCIKRIIAKIKGEK